ncbi:Uncharacterised protein [Nocardia otitidiscaviarum]|uniref:Uncharacterized protein n=1 Tax=Nocardia otitidiscaviarum TaxID=1823 RepID=A0A379JJ62_9NOCA|nr:Uncharacterised protein [Nocardia otitidiscaviarum]
MSNAHPGTDGPRTDPITPEPDRPIDRSRAVPWVGFL